jgi:uncharacterized protein YabN with tetrapyrrole methylase and pyrophosphatase domain
VGVPVTNLLEMYVEGALRTDNYDAVARRIIAALDTTDVVGYVTYGNPFIYDSVSQRLAQHAAAADVPLKVVPSVSSIDTLLCDLRVDLAPGVQILEASWLLAARIPLTVTAPVILVQLGTFGSFRAHYRNKEATGSLEALSEYLLSFYPSSHRAFLVRSGDRMKQSNVLDMPLGDLAGANRDLFLGASMYIPAQRDPKLSRDVVARMTRA